MTREEAIDKAVRRVFEPYALQYFWPGASRRFEGIERRLSAHRALEFDIEKVREIHAEFRRIMAEAA